MRGPRASICSLNGSSAKGGPARAARGIIWNPRYAYWLYVIRCLSPMSIGTLMETTQTRSCEFQLPFNILMFFWFLPTKSQHRQSCFGVNFHANFGQTLLIPPSIRCRAVTPQPRVAPFGTIPPFCCRHPRTKRCALRSLIGGYGGVLAPLKHPRVWMAVCSLDCSCAAVLAGKYIKPLGTCSFRPAFTISSTYSSLILH